MTIANIRESFIEKQMKKTKKNGKVFSFRTGTYNYRLKAFMKLDICSFL
jgi:hypothetical protein